MLLDSTQSHTPGKDSISSGHIGNIAKQSFQRMEVVDWLRGLAALWVICYHVNIVIQKEKYFASPSLGLWAETGHRGVDLFFILSGFVMAMSVPTRSHVDIIGMRGFLLRRVMRIFPAYLAVFLPLCLIAALTGIGAPEAGGVWRNFLPNLLLLPRDDLTTYMPVVAWTLSHELIFYIIFSTVFIKFEIAFLLLISWSILCVIFWINGFHFNGWAMQFNLVNIYFIVGVISAYSRNVFYNNFRSNRLLLMIISFIIVIYAVVYDPYFGYGDKISLNCNFLLYSLGFSLLIISSSMFEGDYSSRKFSILNIFGRQSYSIYLVHYPIIIIIAMITSIIWSNSISWMILPLAVIASLAASWIIYVVIEAPGIALGRKLVARNRQGRTS